MNRDKLKVAIKWGISVLFLIGAFGPLRRSPLPVASILSYSPRSASSHTWMITKFQNASFYWQRLLSSKHSYLGFSSRLTNTYTMLKWLFIWSRRNYERGVEIMTLKHLIRLACWACCCQPRVLRVMAWAPASMYMPTHVMKLIKMTWLTPASQDHLRKSLVIGIKIYLCVIVLLLTVSFPYQI